MKLLSSLGALVVACLLAGIALAQGRPAGTALVVALPVEASWEEFAFLAALSASSHTNAAAPLVLAVGPDGALPAETRDFLARRRPERVLWIGADPDAGAPAEFAVERLAGTDADTAACALAQRFFVRSESVVLCSDGDYTGALAGAVLAARQRVPLFYASGAGLSELARAELVRLGATKVLVVGTLDTGALELGKAKVERLAAPVDVARWMQAHRHEVHYLAAAVPADRAAGHARKLSLSAAVLAAGREGALVPLGTEQAPPESFASARATIEACRGALGSGVEFLCLAGLPESIPMAVIPGSGVGIDTDPPSDLEYGNIDADPFVELAVGRFVAEDGAAGTLLAARSLAYEHLLAPDFARDVAMAEWERTWTPLFANVGFGKPALHEGEQPIGQGSPLASASALLHSAHSSWLQLGATYMHDSRVLLAPCLVETGGCSPAALDSDPEHRSVALRLLRNGAIGFVGSVRRAVAQHELYRSEFWNAVLEGRSLGAAHRHALNRALVACLAREEAERGVLRYQLHNAAFYGDPALVLHLPGRPRSRAASAELRGRDVTVRGPAEWSRVEPFAPSDWKYDASPVIYSWRGAGVGIESSWDGQFRRNREIPVFTVEVRTERQVSRVEALDAPAAPLGWDGRHFVDEHADGTRSVHFRVRLIDFDMSTGKVLEQVERLRFRLE